MNNDLMLAVLALDAYEEKSVGNTIGEATVATVSDPNGSGFAAVAYTYNGETIISFRGTDGGWAAANDIFNGWSELR